jgi:FAD/FMN-containing dehydrogenase/Fe-S oxidoreductase
MATERDDGASGSRENVADTARRGADTTRGVSDDKSVSDGTWDTSAAALGHERPDVPAHAALAAGLRERVSGDVAFDEYAQVLYATDGSIYGARPAGVVAPRDTADVQAAVEVAREHGVPILPRGAGSSLAGQAVGPGCVVLDLSRYMDAILDIDPENRTATVQPGVVQDDLDDRLAEHGLKFAPDPASSNRATLGGGIGNNSTGAHSVRYGITDAYTEELRVVLADGTLLHTREVILDSPEWEEIVSGEGREAQLYETVRGLVEDNAAEIEARYPELKRSVSGYNLQKVIYETDDGERAINLSKLFVGAEGTLGVVVEATVSLVTQPEETALALFCYEDLGDAMRAVPRALEQPVSAVELMDEEVIRLAADSPEYAEYAEPIPAGTAAVLMLEWDSELVDDFAAAVADARAAFLAAGDGGESARDQRDSGGDDQRSAAFDVLTAFADDEQATFWKLRKAAIPLLMSLEGDPKPYPFIEDASVPPEELAEYVASFEEILADHDTSAAYFAHAGAGTLHIRPILNLKDAEGIETMHSITEDVTDLVLRHHGSFSGEHGDGLARTEFNPKLYGEQLWSAFKRLKTAFDPAWQLNPGKVVYLNEGETPPWEGAGPDGRRPGDGVGGDDDDGDDSGAVTTADLPPTAYETDMREHLRYGPAYTSVEPQTTLDFSEEGGFSQLVELCNGCGTCRQTGSDVMCPTYRASREEIQTTRGRANLLRAAISGDLPREELHSERFQSEVLDLCIGCKGCSSDCPTGVDLAKLKAEVKHQHHEETGAGFRERLFANIDTAARWGSALAPLSNWTMRVPGARWLAERLFGIASERSLPTFARESFDDWWHDRGGAAVPADKARAEVVFFPDTYTNYVTPAVGKAAIRVLEAADVHVVVPEERVPSGRAAVSGGFLDLARARAAANVKRLRAHVNAGRAVVCAEPSDAVVFQDEYRDLLSGERASVSDADVAVDADVAADAEVDAEAVAEADAEAVADATYSVLEYVDTMRLDEHVAFDAPAESLAYHGHCNQKAVGTDHHAVGVLRRAGYDVDPLDTTCCGMAGSFGYEAEHYDLSKGIGELLFDAVDESNADVVTAPGASCRTQLGDRETGHGGASDGETRPPHPVEKVAEALTET